MRGRSMACIYAVAAMALVTTAVGGHQDGQAAAQNSAALAAQNTPDPIIQALVGRLSLDGYKATIKGLTRFGDRREGTQHNRDAVDWIEAQLKTYGYDNATRVSYEFPAAVRGC